MKIYLLRHGEYILQDLQKAGELSEKGVADLKKMVHFIRPLDLHVSNILHSGKTRAMQTAEIIAAGFHSEEPPQHYTGLNPEDVVDAIIDDVTYWNSDIVLVGHLPFMSRFAGKLLAGDETKEIVVFQPATMVCLEGDANSSFSINWVLNSALFP